MYNMQNKVLAVIRSRRKKLTRSFHFFVKIRSPVVIIFEKFETKPSFRFSKIKRGDVVAGR